MDLGQLLTSVQNVLDALEVSDLVMAVHRYRHDIVVGHGTADDTDLTRASEQYMNRAALYGQSETALAEKLDLSTLESPGFWFDISASTLDATERLSLLDDVQARLDFACNHLPGLLAIADGNGIVDSDRAEIDNAMIRLRLHDAVEKASYPDRISRLIDGVDMIYQSCANLAGESADGLELLSVSGQHYRSVVFKGHPEVSTATRRIIRALYEQASSCLQEENYSVDEIAEAIPFMHAIDELFRVNALDANAANDIRDGVLAGSIMLLECGGRIYGGNNEDQSVDRPDAAMSVEQMQGRSQGLMVDAESPDTDMAYDDEIEYLVLELNSKYKNK